MSVKKFYKELSGNRVEGELFKSAFYCLIASLLVFCIFYFSNLKFNDSFSLVTFSMIGLSILSYSMLMPVLRQVRAYGKQGHTEGMMIGMTLGMLAGFLSGFFVGGTNGMFIGGVFGMFVGISLGIWVGNCCGVMGVLEGAMAGLMGGLMGAMTAVMTLNDHLILMGVIIFFISAFITSSLWYMIYLSAESKKRAVEENHLREIIISALLTAVTILIMTFGPRSFLLQ